MQRTRRPVRRQQGLIAIGAVGLIALVASTAAAMAPTAEAEGATEVSGTITYAIADLHLEDDDGAIDLDDHEYGPLLHHEPDDDTHVEHGDRIVMLDPGPHHAPLSLDIEEIPDDVSAGDEVTVTTTTSSLERAETLDEPVDVLDVRASTSTTPEMSTADVTTGQRTMLVIQARYSGEAAQWSHQHMNDVMGQVSDWFDTTSRGRVELTYEINPDVTITNIGCGNYGFDAHTAAVAASGRDVASFDHVLVDLPVSTGCDGFAGVAFMPGSRIVTIGSNGFRLGTITHEIGHNLGLGHSEWAWCWDGNTPLVLASRANELAQCGYITYIDPDTVMGRSSYHQPFSGAELRELGWLHDDEVVELAEGSITLHDLTSATPGPRLAVITAPDGGAYILEFRSAATHSFLGTTDPGVVVRYASTQAVLPRLRLDTTPGGHGSHPTLLNLATTLDASLHAGSPAWIDPTGTVRIEVDAQGPSSATLQIDDLSTADASKYTSVAPSRILDTRPDRGIGTVKGAVAPNGTITVPVTGVGGVPAVGVSAVTLNVTATGSIRDGYVTVFPSGVQRPLASAINLTRPQQTRANQVTVPVGVDGNVSMFTTAGGHMIADVAGYYTEVNSSAEGRLVSTTPRRILDTRPGTSPPAPVGGSKSKPAPGATIDVQVAGVGDVPATGAAAVVMNVTATGATAPGHVTVWPNGISRPTASSINLDAVGATVPNLVTVPIGVDGRVKMFTSAGADLLADVVGHVTAEGGLASRSGLFQPTTPTRWFDTRQAPNDLSDLPSWWNSPDLFRCLPGCSIVQQLTGQQPVPLDSAAVLVNTTSTRPHLAGHVTVYPGDELRPLASNLNLSGSDDIRANAVVGKLGSGSLAFHLSAGGYVIGDIGGYWLR